MQNRLLIAGAVSTIVLVLFLAAGAIPVHGGDPTILFQTPAFLAAASAGAIFLLAACFLRRPPVRQTAFALTHAGLVLLMAGAVIDGLGEQRIDGVRLPVGMGHAIGKLRDAEGQTVDLGFTLEVVDFSVSFYDPVYSLFRPDASVPDGLVFARKIDPRVPSTLRQVPGGALDVANLQEQGHWMPELRLADGWILRKQAEIPRWFEAGVRTTFDGVTRSSGLAVNHPVFVNGWQVLLVSYGSESMTYVELAFKKSPGRRLVVAGIWCVITGVFLLCLVLPLARKDRHAVS
jgi:cytochrome c biogenesis protein ResB